METTVMNPPAAPVTPPEAVHHQATFSTQVSGQRPAGLDMEDICVRTKDLNLFYGPK